MRLQLILLYMLLGSVAIAALIATGLAYRNFFTPAHQLRDLPPASERRLPAIAGVGRRGLDGDRPRMPEKSVQTYR